MKTKKVIVMIALLLLIVSISSNIYASDKTIWEMGKEWLDTGKQNNSTVSFNSDVPKQGFLDIAGILMGIGIFIAVGVGIILGIKFMFSTAEGKAEISKLLVPYLIGIAIVIGALTIWKIAINILDI